MLGRLVRLKTNTLATDWLQDNYERVIQIAERKGFKEDIVGDVYLSLKRSEESGKPFDGRTSEKLGDMKVAQFVMGRLNKYGMNAKYSSNIVEGNSKNLVVASSSSCNSEDMGYFQKAYYMASEIDLNREAIENETELIGDIEYVIECGKHSGINIKEFVLYCMDTNGKIGKAGKSITKIKELIENVTFREAFENVMESALGSYQGQVRSLLEEM